MCVYLNLSKRTLNYKINDNLAERKIRSDSIIKREFFAATLHTIFENNKKCIGHKKVHVLLNKSNVKCSPKTVNRAMNQYHLYAAQRHKHKKIYELKNTSVSKKYLLDKNLINEYKPNEVFSWNFTK